MRTSIILSIFLALAFSFQCKLKGHKPGKAPDLIQLDKGACYGTCKMYTIVIDKEGYAKYTGKLNVTKTGEYKKKIDQVDVDELWVLIKNAGLFTLNNEYDTRAEDLPLKVLKYSENGKIKEIRYKNQAPKVLHAIENKLESISESDGWEKAPLTH